VLRLPRTHTVRTTGKSTQETVYAITSLTVADAGYAQIATWLRGHLLIENQVHWVRDVDYDEDRCCLRTGSAPQVMATSPIPPSACSAWPATPTSLPRPGITSAIPTGLSSYSCRAETRL
jgi:hypothetical protein